MPCLDCARWGPKELWCLRLRSEGRYKLHIWRKIICREPKWRHLWNWKQDKLLALAGKESPLEISNQMESKILNKLGKGSLSDEGTVQDWLSPIIKSAFFDFRPSPAKKKARNKEAVSSSPDERKQSMTNVKSWIVLLLAESPQSRR